MRSNLIKSGLAAAVLPTATLAYQGFNYGNLDINGGLKPQSWYEDEFNFARNLAGTNGEFTSARLYTSVQGDSGAPNEAFTAAINTNTSLLLGIWTSGDPNIQIEIDAIIAFAEQHGSTFTDLIAGISVGSEDVYRATALGAASGAGPGVEPQGVADYIAQVRSGFAGTALEGKPIGHVDTYNTFANASGWMAPVIEAVDFIGMNAFPYFETTKLNSIENGNATFWEDYDAVAAVAGDTEIWITETGWPSQGPQSGDAVASVENAETYFGEVACSIFARDINVWWYTLQDTSLDESIPRFGVVELGGGFEPKYDLSC